MSSGPHAGELIEQLVARDAEIARLKGENSRLKSENARLLLQRDRLDCSVREGVGTYHCPADNPCAACVMRAELARLNGEVAVLERDLGACRMTACDNCRLPSGMCPDCRITTTREDEARRELEGDDVQP